MNRTIARKHRGGEDWYVGSITDGKARKLTLPLTFLDPGRRYRAEIYRDGDRADYRDASVQPRSCSSANFGFGHIAAPPRAAGSERLYPAWPSKVQPRMKNGFALAQGLRSQAVDRPDPVWNCQENREPARATASGTRRLVFAACCRRVNTPQRSDARPARNPPATSP